VRQSERCSSVEPSVPSRSPPEPRRQLRRQIAVALALWTPHKGQLNVHIPDLVGSSARYCTSNNAQLSRAELLAQFSRRFRVLMPCCGRNAPQNKGIEGALVVYISSRKLRGARATPPGRLCLLVVSVLLREACAQPGGAHSTPHTARCIVPAA